jgi:stage II sporulation protein AA (anti-sigma F factor antagonist)
MNSFRHTVTDHGDHVTLALAGDLDFAAHSTLMAQITTLLGVGRAVVIDCEQVTFMDSMGLRALIEGVRLAESRGLGFELCAVSQPVTRVIELSGTAGLFTIRGAAVPEETEA